MSKTEETQIEKICYLCKKLIENEEDVQHIPFKEDGMVSDMWYAHIKCYNEAQRVEMETDMKEYQEELDAEEERWELVENLNPKILGLLDHFKKVGLTKDDFITLLHRKVRKHLSRTKVEIVVNAIISIERKVPERKN